MRYAFDDYLFDVDRAELSAGGEPVPLEPKTFDLLALLVENRHRVVSKDEIFDRVWPGVLVSEASISSAIKQVRQALNDSGDAQTMVRTVRGKGFRFVADVTAEAGGRPAALASDPDPAPVPSLPDRLDGPPAIAVLPFVLIQTDDGQRAIADGLPSEIISALSRLRNLKVIARGSSFQIDPAAPDHAALRHRLGVGYVLSGAVELSGARLLVTTELTETANGYVLWAETYTTALDDVFSVRQSIVRAVCNAVEIRIPLNEADRLSGAPTESLDAWGHYHVGLRHLLWFRGTRNDLCKQHMHAALRLDPGFARAQSALAYAELEDHNFLISGDGSSSRAKGIDLAERAVELDPFDPFCNLVLSRAHWVSQDLEAALSWADRSVQLNHNYAFGHYELGKFHAIACKGAQAENFAGTALSLSPLDPNVSGMLSTRALAAYVRDDGAAALQFADASMRAPNRHLYVCALAAAIYCTQGQMERAANAVSKIDGWNDRFSRAHFEHLFSLKDPEKHNGMISAFERLGLL
jgi:TolB-like protein